MQHQKSIIVRSIRIIDAISKSPDGLRFSDASMTLGTPSPSTVSKILKELTREGVLQKTPEGRYVLGRRIYFWGRVMVAQNPPIQIIREQMRSLLEKYQVSVNLFTCTGQTMFCLECYMDAKSPLLYPAGKSLPMHLSVQGAVFFIAPDKLSDLAFLESEAELHEETLLVEDLKKMIHYAQSNDIQDDFALFYPGTHRFSVPIRENGRTIMTLGVGVSLKRTRESDLAEKIVAELQRIRIWIEASFE